MTEPLRSNASEPHGAPKMPALERQSEGLPRWPAAVRAEAISRLVIPRGTRLLVVHLEEVDWFEGAGNYVRVHVGSEGHLHRQTLALLHARLDPRRFARIHRSTIVRLDAVAQIDSTGAGGSEVALRNGTRLAISRRYRRELLSRLGAE